MERYMRFAFEAFEHQASIYRRSQEIMDLVDPARRIHETVGGVELAQRALEQAGKQGISNTSNIAGLNNSVAEMLRLAGGGDNEALLSAAQSFSATDLIHEQAMWWGSESLLGVAGLEKGILVNELMGKSMVPSALDEMLQSVSTYQQALKSLVPDIPDQHIKTLAEMMHSALSPNILGGILQSGSAAQQAMAGLSDISSAAQRIKDLASLSEPAWMSDLQRMTLSGAHGTEEYLGLTSPGMTVFERARASVEALAMDLRGLDWLYMVEGCDNEQEETQACFKDLSASLKEQTNFQGLLAEIFAQTARLQPKLQAAVLAYLLLPLLLFLRRMWEQAPGAVLGAALGVAAAQYLSTTNSSTSPQEILKNTRQIAREAVSSPALLKDFRFVRAEILVVRLNPRIQSPKLGTLKDGSVVQVLKREGPFSLIEWVDHDRSASLHGWVLSRYLHKFI